MDMLEEDGEVWWDTRDDGWEHFLEEERVPVSALTPLNAAKHQFMGGVNVLQDFHFAIVKGGAWSAQ